MFTLDKLRRATREGKWWCGTTNGSQSCGPLTFFWDRLRTPAAVSFYLWMSIPVILGWGGLGLQTTDEKRVLAAEASGREVYKAHCANCHGSEGRGIVGVYPPVRDADWIRDNSSDSLLSVLIHGMRGKVKVNGKVFNGVMSGIADSVSPARVIALVHFLQRDFNNLATSGTVADVRRIRASNAK